MKVKTQSGLYTIYLELGGLPELWKAAGPVGAARHIALECWLKERPEDELTKELRRQLNYLDSHGFFDYVEYYNLD